MTIQRARAIGLLVTWLIQSACVNQGTPAETQTTLRMNGGTLAYLNEALRSLPDITPQIIAAEGSGATLEALKDRQADIGIVMADVAYHTYSQKRETQRFDQLRGMAVLTVNTVHLAAGPQTDIYSVADLGGRRVSLGPVGAATPAMIRLVLEASGLPLGQIRIEPLPNPEAVERLASGELDAAFLSFDPSVEAAIRSGARFIDVYGPWLEALRLRYPFLLKTTVPIGTYAGQNRPFRTVGVDSLLVCHADLDTELAYRIVKSHIENIQRHELATDLERTPATPIPLHAGAARYYRERTLSR